MSGKQQHFLDTSVAYKMLLGTRVYKRYFATQFGADPCYISAYVLMELKRSYLVNAIAFYFLLNLPTVSTLDEAAKLWSNNFKGSQLKAGLQLYAEIQKLCDAHQIKSSLPSEKQRVLQVFGLYLKRVERKMRCQFTDISQDTTHCARAIVPLQSTLETLPDGLRRFLEAFEDTTTCRNKCSIDDFILRRHRNEIESYIRQAEQLPNNQHSRGFIKIADNLRDIVEKGGTACSCKKCESIGDAVIALQAPRTIRLEHTDNSFNHLCQPLNQSHHQHPSESAVVKPQQLE